jgi:hypothetical protein
MKNYKIMHTMVGPFPAGRVVTEEQLKYNDDVDLERLLDLEAIEETDEKATKTVLAANPENVIIGDEAPEEPHSVDAPQDEGDEQRNSVRKLPGGRVADMHGSDRPTVAATRKSKQLDLSRTGTRKVSADNKDTTDDDTDPAQLKKMTVAELREMADRKGVKDYESMKKEELIDALSD